MSDAGKTSKLGPNGRPVRPFVMPETLSGKLTVWRYLLLRRAMQLGTLLLFFGTVNWDWKIAEQPVLSGNLSSSELLGLIPLADPFAILQIVLTGQVLLQEVLLGGALILALVAIIGGRTWCAWICPLNMVTDLAAWIRRRLQINDVFRLSRKIRYTVLALSLLLSVLTGIAAFEWISPISMLHRELIYGIGAGWVAVLGVFLFVRPPVPTGRVLCHCWINSTAAHSVRYAHLHPLRRMCKSLPGTAGAEHQGRQQSRHDRIRRMHQLRPLHSDLP